MKRKDIDWLKNDARWLAAFRKLVRLPVKRNRVASKRENYVLFLSGFYGNKPLTWDSYDEVMESGWSGNVNIRSKKGIERGLVEYDTPISELKSRAEKWRLKNKHLESEITFNQKMPDDHLIIQGEVMNWIRRLYLHYSTLKKPMNIGLREESFYAECVEALKLLKGTMDPPSFENLEWLLEHFPDSVIEFSTYDIPLGNLNRNTVFWEVRDY
ncbi:MAG: hypothetical protein WC796_04970 [Candidatus Pacearchaeota archaeon]|jgi:hypothetical protein